MLMTLEAKSSGPEISLGSRLHSTGVMLRRRGTRRLEARTHRCACFETGCTAAFLSMTQGVSFFGQILRMRSVGVRISK